MELNLDLSEINTSGKFSNIWKLSKSVFHNPQVKQKVFKEIRNTLNYIKMKIQQIKICEMWVKQQIGEDLQQ